MISHVEPVTTQSAAQPDPDRMGLLQYELLISNS
jgi:hypothetical protein